MSIPVFVGCAFAFSTVASTSVHVKVFLGAALHGSTDTIAQSRISIEAPNEANIAISRSTSAISSDWVQVRSRSLADL